MADLTIDNSKVYEVFRATALNGERSIIDRERRQRGGRREGHHGEVCEHYEEMVRIVEVVHEALERQGLPYRVCVYREGRRIFLDVVALDKEGQIASIVKKDITHRDFFHWLQRLQEEEGVYLDGLV